MRANGKYDVWKVGFIEQRWQVLSNLVYVITFRAFNNHFMFKFCERKKIMNKLFGNSIFVHYFVSFKVCERDIFNEQTDANRKKQHIREGCK